VFAEEHPTLSAALSREYQLKRWTRKKKLALIAGARCDSSSTRPTVDRSEGAAPSITGGIMHRRPRFHIGSVLGALALVATVAGSAPAQDLAPIKLPAPQTEGGKPLMQARKARATSRAFAPDPLPAQTLSNLLWAAWGVNRPDSGKRTAPSARDWRETDVYVVMAAAAYLYDAAANTLTPVAGGDLRALTGTQDFVKDAPVTLVLVADTARMKGAQADMQQAYAWGDAAFISQNVYLFCASEGLATGVRASVDREPLAKALKLGTAQLVVFAQSVGQPKK
jgi:nitroreductase